ncbi:hypothetical protein ACFLWN_01660 [Chloroflexota bacterium]
MGLWISPILPLHLLVQLVNLIIPGWLLQKIFLFLILFIAGLGAHRLVGSGKAGAYFAGIFYMINPFVYVRFLAGQWAVLWPYAFAPFAIAAFIRLLRQGGRRNAIQVALLSILVGLPHIAGLFLLFLAFLIILVIWLVTERKELSKITSTAKYIGISAGIFLILNLYWLVPVLTEKETIVSQISQADLLAFAPIPSSVYGVAFDIVSMYGFWRGGYVYTKDILPFWWVFFLFIMFLAVFGFMSRLGEKKQQHIVLSFGLIGIVSLFLALGVTNGISMRLFGWLWEHLFFFRGFRDSQKFVALLCLVYAYLGGLGVNEFTKVLRQQSRKLPKISMTALVTVALLTPLAYSFTMFSFHGQLGVTDYPREWYKVNEYLNRDGEDFNVLVLPWHMYMDYSWLPNRDKRLANPGMQFFDKPVISGDNIEVSGIYSQSTNPISKYVEFVLENGGSIHNLGELLAPLNVKYVILIHEADYATYDFIYRQDDLKVEMEEPGITLFKNDHATARFYGVDSVVYISSLEEYLELSQKQDVMQHLYIIEKDLKDDNAAIVEAEIEKLDFVEESPVKYWVSGTSRSYTIFIVPQNVSTNNWEYNAAKPKRNLGFMPAFYSSPDSGEVVYNRFYSVYLPSYIVSSATIAFVVWYYFKRRTRSDNFHRQSDIRTSIDS